MQPLTAVLLFFAARAVATPQSTVAPLQPAPPGCSSSYDGEFNLSSADVTPTGKTKRQSSTPYELAIILKSGILTDGHGGTGFIAANHQLLFTNPPLDNAIYIGGFSVCQNGSLALGSDAIWYRCFIEDSSTGHAFISFFFQYEVPAGQCITSYLQAVPLASGDGPAPGSAATSPSASGTSTSRSASSSTSTTASAIATTAAVTGTDIGVGVGIGVGIPCLVVSLFILFYFHRRLKAERVLNGAQSMEGTRTSTKLLQQDPTSHELSEGKAQAPELPVKESPQELPAEHR